MLCLKFFLGIVKVPKKPLDCLSFLFFGLSYRSCCPPLWFETQDDQPTAVDNLEQTLAELVEAKLAGLRFSRHNPCGR